ncbi:uncharacterized protein LOC124271098 [Haliotis rubra]|uniref:uncharacterized protein LOC124271098 n=1 Tax=Haliotis rubra TaxID=36100 RepID=UPI001EE598AF|nr:uncharacterized protein LOC124271098 [Haliotis rubra]
MDSMIVVSLVILLLCNGALAQLGTGLTFTVTPSEITMCGAAKTSRIEFDCRVTASVSDVFSIELGRKTIGGDNSPIARIVGAQYHSLIVLDRRLSSKLIQTNWGKGCLSVRLNNPETADLQNYYCSAAYMSAALSYSEVVIDVHDKTLRTQAPGCTRSNIDWAVQQKALTSHGKAGRCADGAADRSEALVLSYCNVPDVDQWHPGLKVVDICCMVPAYTPVATFVFGIYVEDEHSISGVFLGCTDQGFSMAVQLCGHPPMIVNLTKTNAGGFVEDANNYHVLQVQGSTIVG